MTDQMQTGLLPQGFDDLEEFAAWALPTRAARSARRYACTIDELQVFYERLEPRIAAILDFLNNCPPQQFGPPEQRLRDLALSLAEVAPAMEYFGTVEVPFGFSPQRFMAFGEE